MIGFTVMGEEESREKRSVTGERDGRRKRTGESGDRRQWVIHPFLLAAAPVLFLYAFNIDQVVPTDALVPLAVSVAAAAVLFAVLRLALGNSREAGVLVSLAVVLFYSYGHVVSALRNRGIDDRPALWLPVFAALLVVGAFLTVRYRHRLSAATSVLNVAAAALVVMSLFNIAQHALRSRPEIPRPEITMREGAELPAPEELPDIYYIILDGYGSQDTLQEFYGFDNSAFLESLRARGFFIPPDTHGNYFETFLSLSASLNMEYLEFLAEDPGPDSNDRSIPYRMIQDNAVSRFLGSSGYRTVFFASGWSGTSHSHTADVTVAGHHAFDNEFYNTLLRTTVFRPLVRNWLFTREAVLSTFEEMPRAADSFEEPCFVFAHIVPPHHPFRFAADGGVPAPRGGEEGRKEAYVGQVQFVNGRLEELVDALLSGEGKKPVIIFQGDHGPSYAGNPASVEVSPGVREPTDEYIRERSGILNAYYLPAPGGGTAALYDGISPANSFREVFNLYLGTEMERLPDRCYYSTYRRPFDFTDVTDRLKEGG